MVRLELEFAETSKTIATGWINAGMREGFLKRLARA
jgi:hypothetical protein